MFLVSLYLYNTLTHFLLPFFHLHTQHYLCFTFFFFPFLFCLLFFHLTDSLIILPPWELLSKQSILQCEHSSCLRGSWNVLIDSLLKQTRSPFNQSAKQKQNTKHINETSSLLNWLLYHHRRLQSAYTVQFFREVQCFGFLPAWAIRFNKNKCLSFSS